MSDTSLVFNLVARDRTGETLGKVKEKFTEVSNGVAVGVAGALGAGVAQAMDMSAANAKLAAQLGIGPGKAAELAKVSANVYANAWGDSAESVNEAIKGVYQNIGDVSQAKGGLEGVTTKAMALAETFDQEVGPTTAAVGQMLKTGLAKNADEAFDILTKGFQSGANKADDLLDTVNEYGTQWRKFGLDGKMATGLLSQGLKGGARDADLVADAIKEFSIRAIDGSTTTAQGFKAIGLNASTMAAKIGKGGSSATAALDQTLDRLRGIKDPIKQAQAATALFGTQAEDLGAALYKLDPSSAVAALGKVDGAADRMSKTLSESPAKSLERFKREATTKLAEVGGQLIQFGSQHQDVVKPLAVTLGGVAAAVLAIRAGMIVWTAAQTAWSAATTVATGAQWLWNAALAASPVTWIIVGIVALVAAVVLIATKTTWFQQLWAAVWSGIKTAAAGAVSVISSVLNWFSGLPGKFSSWWGSAKTAAVAKMLALVAWMTGLPGRVTGALASLATKLIVRASSAMQSFRDAVVSKALALVGWMAGLPGRVSSSIGSLNGLLVQKGRNVVQGLWNGIQSMGGWIASKISGWAKSVIPGPVAKALGIASPSKVTAAQGRWIARGLIEGLTGSSKQVKAASQKLADIVRDALSGRKESKALGVINAGSKKLMALAAKEEAVAARLKTANKRLSDLIAARDKLAADVKKGVLDAANITQMQQGEGPVTADSILVGLKDKTAAAQKFAANLAALRKKGVRADLIAQIAQAGVEQGGAAAAALASADKATIGQINMTQGKLVAAAGKAGDVAGDAMYGSGIKAAQGLVKGLQREQKAIEKQMLTIAKAMTKAIKKALGIHSPSALMADEVGRFIPPGVVQGMQATAPQLDTAMRQLVRPELATVPGPRTATGMAPQMGAQSGGGIVRVRLEFGGAENEVKKLFRKIVRVDGRGNVQTAFGQ